MGDYLWFLRKGRYIARFSVMFVPSRFASTKWCCGNNRERRHSYMSGLVTEASDLADAVFGDEDRKENLNYKVTKVVNVADPALMNPFVDSWVLFFAYVGVCCVSPWSHKSWWFQDIVGMGAAMLLNTRPRIIIYVFSIVLRACSRKFQQPSYPIVGQ